MSPRAVPLSKQDTRYNVMDFRTMIPLIIHKHLLEGQAYMYMHLNQLRTEAHTHTVLYMAQYKKTQLYVGYMLWTDLQLWDCFKVV